MEEFKELVKQVLNKKKHSKQTKEKIMEMVKKKVTLIQIGNKFYSLHKEMEARSISDLKKIIESPDYNILLTYDRRKEDITTR